MANLGFDYEAVNKLNPRIIYCSISGFGQTGPYASRGGFDLARPFSRQRTGLAGGWSSCRQGDGRDLAQS
jgi:crotonobetainyl-CoA:carnitine CoA-transferase CaiB-like acyl-CoA transferase